MLLSPTPAMSVTATRAATSPASQPAVPDLDPVIPLVDFRATSFGKAIDVLREVSKVNIVVRWQTLNDVGIGTDSPVDLRVANLPLQRVLELLGDVAQAAPEVFQTPLAARAERGVVIVSTRGELENDTTVCLYDVRDLIESDMSVRTRIEIGQSSTMPTTLPTPEERHAQALEQLKRAIEDTIDPESWRDAGGTVGSIEDFNGRVIVSQTPMNQARIAKLLEDLRRK